MDAVDLSVTQSIAEAGSVERVAYAMRDVPGVLALLSPEKVREHGVAMIVEAVTLGDWSVKDLAMSLVAMRDRLLAQAVKTPGRTRNQGSEAGDRAAIEVVRERISARGYCPWSAVQPWARVRPDSFFTGFGYEIITLEILRNTGKWYTVQRALVVAGVEGGAKWRRKTLGAGSPQPRKAEEKAGQAGSLSHGEGGGA